MSLFHRLKRMFAGRDREGGGHVHGSAACREAASLLYDYLDGELKGVSAERVRRHFEVCRMCYPHLRFEESFRAAMHRAGAGERAPEELKEHLRELLKDA